MSKEFDRFYVALGLPIKEDGYTIDYDNYREVVRYFATDDFFDFGGSFIVNAEAGELFTLTRKEKSRLSNIVAEEVNGRAPFFCGACNSNPHDMQDELRDAIKDGAAGIFVMPSIGSIDVTHAWNVRAFPQAYGNVCRNVIDTLGEVPMICHGSGPKDPYYGVSFPIEVIDYLLDNYPSIVGWKMMYNFKPLKEVCGHLRQREADGKGHVALLQASAHMFYEDFFYDFLDGTVSCFWNYAKEKTMALITNLKQGNYEEAKKIWLDGKLFNLHNLVGNNRLHTNFKVACWMKGLYKTPFARAPMVNATKKELLVFRDAMIATGDYVLSDEEFTKVYNQMD